ncbi:unnamed protein product [Brassica oleracea]
MGRSYSYRPSPPRRRYRSPSPVGYYKGRSRDAPTSLLVRNLRLDCRCSGQSRREGHLQGLHMVTLGLLATRVRQTTEEATHVRQTTEEATHVRQSTGEPIRVRRMTKGAVQGLFHRETGGDRTQGQAQDLAMSREAGARVLHTHADLLYDPKNFVMEALFLNSSSSSIAAPNKLFRRDWCTLVTDKKRLGPTWCRVGGGGGDGRSIKPERPIRVSSLLKDRGQVLIRDQSSPAMDADTLVVSPNGNEKAIEINGVKTLLPPFSGSAKVLDTELFNTLRETHGASYQSFMLDKLVPVTGNICDSNIGLQVDSAEEIAKEVDVIINSAANTTFNERYDVALDINTRGPGNLMGFAKKCKKLKLFLQVSTAYVNGQRQGRIMEKPFSMGDCIATENFLEGNRKALDVDREMKLALDAARKGTQFQEEAQKMKDLGLER